MTRTPAHVLCLSLALACGPALAANLGFLKETPYAKFKPQDRELLNATIDKALKEGQEGAALDWKNEVTGSGGSVTPEKRFERDGMSCQTLRIVNTHKTLRGEGSYNFCQQKNGKWVLSQ